MNQTFFNDSSDSTTETEWMSIGDLMAGLLLIFALLITATLYELSKVEENLRNRRVIVIQVLQEQFNAHGIAAQVNSETGDVNLLDEVLFETGRAELTNQGNLFLENFVPVYGRAIFKDPTISEEVTRVIIEGHTSSEGSSSYNMALSLKRANSVFNFIDTYNFTEKQQLLNKLQVSGRGRLDADSTKSLASDRKVVFRMQFKSDEASFRFMNN